MAPTLAAPRLIEEDVVGLADLVRFIIRHWRTITLCCLAGGAVATLWGVVQPRQYEAAATMVVMPSKVITDLRPGVINIQGIQRLLESDAVINETVRRLLETGTLREGQRIPELGRELESRIYTSRREEGHSLAPIVELISRSSSAEGAAEASNTWAEMLLKCLHDLKGRGTTDNIELVETQYEKAKETVLKRDKERLDAAEEYNAKMSAEKVRWRRKIDAAQVDFDRRLTKLQTEMADQVAAFQLESPRKMVESLQNLGLSIRGTSSAEIDFSEPGKPDLSAETKAKILELMDVRIQLAQTAELVTMTKTVTNDALWQAAVLGQANLLDLEVLPNLSLLDQEVNTAHSELSKQLLKTTTELEQVLQEDEQALVQRIRFGMEEVQRKRRAELEKMLTEQAQEMDELRILGARTIEELRQEYERNISDLNRRSTAHLTHLEQVATDAREHFSQLANKYSQAELARGEQQLADVRLAARAVPPRAPLDQRLVLKIMLGLFLGGVFGLFAALVRQVVVSQ